MSKKKVNQPNFGELFRREKPKKIQYEIRPGPHRRHDLAYFSSYLHDARLTLERVKCSRKRLKLPVDRDCWELPLKKHAKSRELYITETEILLTPVIEYHWEFSSDTLQEAMSGKSCGLIPCSLMRASPISLAIQGLSFQGVTGPGS